VRARSLASQSEKLASLATLATGAAHELSTPLSTIAVVAKELERALSRPDAASLGDTVQSDARLIRREVERCREILQRMAADAGHIPEPDEAPMSVAELLRSAVQGIPRASEVQLTLEDAARAYTLQSQAQAVSQALRGVLKNAVQASPSDKPIQVTAELTDTGCKIEVRDFGVGMSDEVLARAGEPFFTTKEPGDGMGLGLFLARVVVDRMGGHFNLCSTQGSGTVATFVLPVKPPATTHRTASRS
jgi:two-component system sensor histidine kinase RegB